MSIGSDQILSLADEYEHTYPPALQPWPVPTGMDLAHWIDHTLLKPEATTDQIKKLCDEAQRFDFATVCVNPSYVPLAVDLLAGSRTEICSVIAFPLGASLPELKAHETCKLIEMGATEIDMVINIGALKSGNISLTLGDVQAVVNAAAGKAKVKVILETALLTQREKIIGCLVCKVARADFVKTSTGFQASGATVEDIGLMRRVVGAEMGIKAAGGIRSLKEAQAMIAAGANRLGSSAGVSILGEILQEAAI
jgi:deoxyribose-phosphate aldolase